MSQGPIEFLSDVPLHETPSTEFGGADGLIQPERGQTLKGDPEASGGHVLDDGPDRTIVGERAAVSARAAMRPLVGREQITGVSETGEEVRDPKTGRLLEGNGLPVTGGKPGELDGLRPE